VSASNAGGERVSGATARSLREIGWGGLELPVEVRVRARVDRVRSGEQLATVTVRGASAVATRAAATRSLAGASLGWRLEHLL